MTRRRGGAARLLGGLLVVLAAGGCSLDGRGELPFARGTGGDAYEITVQMADVGNLVPHAEVKVNDITVGTVTGIRMVDWRAVLQVKLQRAAVLPADAVANVGQKSLLGAQYLQLAAPAGSTTPERLTDGSTIPIERTGTYPGTEDLLIALSSFLNGSGLTQLKTVVAEMNAALDGRTDDIKAMLTHLQQVSESLAGQRQTIAQLLERMNTLTRQLADASPVIDRSLPALAPGLAALEAQRPALMRALRSIEELDAVATPVLEANADGLVTEVRQLRPVLGRLADTGNKLAGSLNVAGTLIYPADKVPYYFRGDYMNQFIDFNATFASLSETILAPPDWYSADGADVPGTAQLMAPTTREGDR